MDRRSPNSSMAPPGWLPRLGRAWFRSASPAVERRCRRVRGSRSHAGSVLSSIRRSSHQGLADKADEDTDLRHIEEVYEAYRGTDTVITAHVGGEHSDLQYHDPHLEPAVEVTSDHGTFEWILQETFERNYRMGFFGGSDSHNGRPGGDTPGFQHRRYAKAGLAAVYARELSIESVLDAYDRAIHY